MLKIRHKNHIKKLREDQHHYRNAYRRPDVLAGIKARSQYFDGDQADQSHAIAHQRSGGLRHVPVRKCAIVIKRCHQRLGKRQKRNSTRQAQQHHNTQAPVQHIGVFFSIVGSFSSCQLGHQYHANRHAQHGGGKLHQAIGIGQPAHTARDQMRRNLRVDKERNLRHTDAQQRGQHQFGNVLGCRVSPGLFCRRPTKADFWQHAQREQCRYLYRQLQRATQHDASSQCVNRLNALRF